MFCATVLIWGTRWFAIKFQLDALAPEPGVAPIGLGMGSRAAFAFAIALVLQRPLSISWSALRVLALAYLAIAGNVLGLQRVKAGAPVESPRESR